MAKITGVTLAGFVLALGIGGLAVSCSDSKSSSDDPRALCVRGCNKFKECTGPLAASVDCTAQCNQAIPDNTATTCTNIADITAKAKVCLEKTVCAEFTTCFDSLPDCMGAAGAGGSTGAGGTGAGGTGAGGTGAGGTAGGTGGAAGTGTCEDCVKADRCAGAFGVDAGPPNAFATACNGTAGAQRAQVIMSCQAVNAIVPNCK